MTADLVADEQLHATAVLAVLNAALPDSYPAYDIDDVPSPRPSRYVEVSTSRRAGGNLRASAETATGGWRVTTRPVDQFSVTNARKAANTVRVALEFARLSVGGKTSTPVQFETSDPIEADDGWHSGLTAWTYAL